MDGQMSYEENQPTEEQLEPTYKVRDQYAAYEFLAALVVEGVGDLPHMRDSAARALNYSFEDLTSAGLAEGDEELADALMHFQKGLAALKRAHNADARVARASTRGNVDVGRPRTGILRRVGQEILDRVPPKMFGR